MKARVVFLFFVTLLVLCVGALLSGCANNGNGLIPAHQNVSGCYTIHDVGKEPREVCSR